MKTPSPWTPRVQQFDPIEKCPDSQLPQIRTQVMNVFLLWRRIAEDKNSSCHWFCIHTNDKKPKRGTKICGRQKFMVTWILAAIVFLLWAHTEVCSIFSIQLIELVIIIAVD